MGGCRYNGGTTRIGLYIMVFVTMMFVCDMAKDVAKIRKDVKSANKIERFVDSTTATYTPSMRVK